MIRMFQFVTHIVVFFVPFAANAAVILVQTSDAGFYNDSLGAILDNTNGGDTPTGYFPVTDDSSVSFPVEPDLSAASAILGNFLTDPLNLNANWRLEASVPNNWTPGTEVGVIYQFDTLGATNVVASFGVDNGVFAWLDGNYLGGARQGGGVSLGEHVFNVGDLSSGTHFLQILLEDHGGTNGYAVEITADTFIPGPPPVTAVPEPSSLVMLSMSLTAACYRQRRKKIKKQRGR